MIDYLTFYSQNILKKSEDFISKLKRHLQHEMSHYEEFKDKQVFIDHEEFNTGKE